MSVKIMGLVWDLPNYPANKKYVLLAYADHADHDGRNIFPSIALVARKTGYSEREIQRITQEIVRDGLLVADGSGPHGTHKWRFSRTGVKMSPQDGAGVTPEDGRGDKPADRGGDIAVSPESSRTSGEKEEEEQESEVVALFGTAAATIWPRDPAPWRRMRADLKGCSLTTRSDALIVRGLGDKAAFYQDRYAQSFVRAFVGVFGREMAVSFEE